MKERSRNAPVKSKPSGSGKTSHVTGVDEGLQNHDSSRSPKRSGYAILALLVLIINGSWAVHHYQFENMPEPLSAEQAGKRGFSEEKAMKHVKALTELGPHPVGSDALDVALQYVLAASEKIRKMAHWEVDVEVDFFHANSGANRLVSGLFKGKTLVYSDLNHIVLRILPKYASEAGDNAILVSSHIDTVFAAEGAGDCSSCIAVMLELARGISHWGHGFKNAVIFLFNTGEEEGLNGAHSFITQHPWSSTLRMAIDLEAMGIGGKSGIFQTGPDSWAIENFAAVAKYPSGQVIAQDLFTSGAIKSATDFQVYEEIAGLSGLDFAYADNTAVYHTKNDKLKLLKMGSLQHLGDNMLAFLLHAAASSHFSEGKAKEADEKSGDDAAIYFDILGSYMIVYRQRFAKMLYNSVIMQSLLIWATSLLMGGAKTSIAIANCILFGLSLTALLSGIAPPFTEDAARAVNVVHVVNTTGGYGEMQEPNSYVSLFSTTPGELTKEVEQIGEGFVCGREKVYDFVTFAVKYSCWTQNDAGSGWSKSDVPALYVESDIRGDDRITHVSMDTKSSTRWTLAINTEEIEDFRFKDSSDELIPVGDKSSADGWHIIQYSGGKNAPTRFNLTLFWVKNYTQDQNPLLRLRTDVDRLTPAVERVLMKLPPWCSLFGKSTSPHTLAFLP
ncbi:hypothetical protein RJ639_006319 [Escallonia herrerae]|uniref:Vacuolar membrane protease n=1 Tax=Escallonia herrerae TaxID=1293975 RepID=A0AA89AUI5_9ASTE|nr:hypothetical protein RJ639_006319 [Escallonia herrerae]